MWLFRSQNELQKQRQESERLSNKLTVIEKESRELKTNLTESQDECKALKQEHQALLEWKKNKENLINQTEAVQKELTDKMISLEGNVSLLNEANNELQVSVTNTQWVSFYLGRESTMQTAVIVNVYLLHCCRARSHP